MSIGIATTTISRRAVGFGRSNSEDLVSDEPQTELAVNYPVPGPSLPGLYAVLPRAQNNRHLPHDLIKPDALFSSFRLFLIGIGWLYSLHTTEIFPHLVLHFLH